MNTKTKGDIAEAKVIADVLTRGHKVAIPYGDNWVTDLVVQRGPWLQRLQVKYVKSNGEYMEAKPTSIISNKGRVQETRQYVETDFEWFVIYDATTDKCYYLPSSVCGNGRWSIRLRLTPAKNGQETGVRWAKDFLVF